MSWFRPSVSIRSMDPARRLQARNRERAKAAPGYRKPCVNIKKLRRMIKGGVRV